MDMDIMISISFVGALEMITIPKQHIVHENESEVFWKNNLNHFKNTFFWTQNDPGEICIHECITAFLLKI